MNDDQSTNGPGHRTWWDKLGHMLAGEPRNRDELVSELRSAHANGLLDSDTLSMLEGAIRVTEQNVDDVMIPRSQMVALGVDAPLDTILATVIESGHSRFPVHAEDSRDTVRGILLAKDLLKCFANGGQCHVPDLLRPPSFIPESMPLNVLLAEFKLSHNHMAIVVDEYGGVSGLVTIEDVLEEIVGEIDDEHDDEDPVMVREVAEDTWLVNALIEIEDFNEQFQSHLADDEFDTVGGLVTDGFGHLPERGEEIALDGYLFQVTQADDRRVQQFQVYAQS